MTHRPSYASGVSTVPLLGQTIGANLAAAVEQVGSHEALVERSTGRRWSYPELWSWARRVARGLAAKGVEKGDRVGIWSPNCAEWVAVQYATALVGAILVNVNPAYRTYEAEYVLRQSGVKVLVSADVHKTSDYRAMVTEIRGGLGDLEDVVFIGDLTWDQLEAGSEAFSEARLDEIGAGLSFDDPINIQYTSGTTGSPRAPPSLITRY